MTRRASKVLRTHPATLITLSLLICWLLASCTALPASAPAGEGAGSDEPVVVTWWTGAGQAEQEVLQREFVDTFNAAHPTIRLELTFPEDLGRVTSTAVQAGEGPDILDFQGYGEVGEYQRAGRLLPLDDYAELYSWDEALLPWAYNVGVIDDQLYSLPLTYESMGTIFYNKTLFDAQGWQPPTTLAELETLAGAMQAVDVIPFANGNMGNAYENQFWVGVFYSNFAGADNVYAALTGEKRWDDEEFVGALNLFQEWMERGWIGGDVESYFSYDWDTKHIMLAEGQGAMMLEGTWGFNASPTYFEPTGQEWDWFRLPPFRTGVETGYDLSIGRILAINANSAHPEAAAEVLDWIYNDKARALKISSAFGYGEWFVPLAFVRADFPTDTDERVLRYIDDFNELAGAQNKVGYTVWTFWPVLSQEHVNELDRVLLGEITIEEYSAGAQELFATEVAEGKVPVIPPTSIRTQD
jgi:raffinose/stachyose/melibiose transport system substrate-binding protein